MIEIAENEYYEIKVDEIKNRIHLTVSGFWSKPEVVPNYVTDVEKAGGNAKSGFTIISDLRKMKAPPKEIEPLHEKAQTALIEAGLDRTAEVLSSAILKMATANYSDSTQMKKQTFSSLEEAENWLDS